MLCSCDPRRASKASCYFDKKVLDSYKKNENRFRIKNNVIYDNYTGWFIKFGINKEKVIHVFLRSLGKLPIEEQYQWKRYNIKPRGGWSKDFFNNQLNLEFTDEDPAFLRNMLVINNLFIKKHGFNLFNELTEHDRYVSETISPTLIVGQQSEFDAETVKLSKLVIDSIDKESLEANTSWKPNKDDENRSLHFLHNFLKEHYNDDVIITPIMERLRLIQKIRSKHGGAHTKSSDYKNMILKELKINTFDLTMIYEKLISEINMSTTMLIRLMQEYNK